MGEQFYCGKSLLYDSSETDRSQRSIYSADDHRELVVLNVERRDWCDWDEIVLKYLLSSGSLLVLYDRLRNISKRDFLVVDYNLNMGKT